MKLKVDNVLKNIYLDVISEKLNTEHPFLSAIEHTSGDVWGKYIRKFIHWGNKHAELCLELANIYGKIEISEKALRVSENSGVAFVDLLNSEIEEMLRGIKGDMSKQLFNDGGICGFSELFKKDGSIYGLDRADYPQLVPYIQEDFGELTEDKLEEVISKFEQRPDFIITSFKVSRFFKSLPNSQADGCFWHDIRVVFDVNCPDNTIYFLNSRNFTLQQLCDWQWLESEDGKILKKADNKPIYTATLVKYANLMCNNPSNQAMLTGVKVDKENNND